jgi:hypothetical protein
MDFIKDKQDVGELLQRLSPGPPFHQGHRSGQCPDGPAIGIPHQIAASLVGMSAADGDE